MIFDRDLSWLGFNRDVLRLARKKSIPLYERINFLAIFSSNLDEFFRVRYPAIVALSKLDKKTIRKELNIKDQDHVGKVQESISLQQEEFGEIFNQELLPALKENNIHVYYGSPIRNEHLNEIREIFLSKVLSFIQPIILDTRTRRDFLPENNELYFVVSITDADKKTLRHTIINIPSKKLKRFYTLTKLGDDNYVIFIDDIVRENIAMLFPGNEIESIFTMKFNRDAELILDNDYSKNILDKIEKQLSRRDKGAASRFLFEKGMPMNLQFFLAGFFNVEQSDIFEGGRYHNLSDLMKLPRFDNNLNYPPLKPIIHPPSAVTGEIFENVLQQDILLHLPYHSYSPVLSFFNQAAVDPDVSHIYITLYRVAAESHIVNALISAAKNGKKVTAIIELKARFDEANNIRWSRVMKTAGIRLIHSEAGTKVHSKIALVRKKIDGKVISFAILSTGNFNEITAGIYTDHVLMTADKQVTRELIMLLEFLQQNDLSAKYPIDFKQLVVSKFNMLEVLENLVKKEISKAKKGKPAMIRIKVNNLEDPWMIDLLNSASKAGVDVRLNIRGICCLVPGNSETGTNMKVKRILGRYLEHSRLFILGAGEDAKVMLGSSDLMIRNLRNRIEVCVNVNDEVCRQELIKYFDLQWSDNVNALMMRSDATYVENTNGSVQINSQEAIHQFLENKI